MSVKQKKIHIVRQGIILASNYVPFLKQLFHIEVMSPDSYHFFPKKNEGYAYIDAVGELHYIEVCKAFIATFVLSKNLLNMTILTPEGIEEYREREKIIEYYKKQIVALNHRIDLNAQFGINTWPSRIISKDKPNA